MILWMVSRAKRERSVRRMVAGGGLVSDVSRPIFGSEFFSLSLSVIIGSDWDFYEVVMAGLCR